MIDWKPIGDGGVISEKIILVTDGINIAQCYMTIGYGGKIEFQGTYYDGYDFEYVYKNKPLFYAEIDEALSGLNIRKEKTND